MAPRRTSQEGRGGAKPSDSPRKRGRRERKKKGECESEPKWKSYPLSALCPGRRPRPVSVFRGSLGPPPRVGSAVNSSSAFDAPVFVVGLLPGSPSSSSSRFSPPSLSFSPLSSSLSPTSSTCWGSSFVPPEASASRCFLFSSNCRSVDCLSPRRFFPRLSSHALSALFLVFSLLLPRLQFPRLSPDSRSCRDEAERRPPSSQVFSSDAVASFSQSCGVPGSVASSPLWIFAAADFQPLAGKSELDFQSSPHIQESERDPTPLSALPAAGKATRLAESDRHDEARQRESSVSVYAERVSAGGEDAQRRLQRRGDERSVMLQTTVHLRDEEIPRKPTDAWARSCPKNPHSSAHIHLPADRVLGVEDVTEKCLRYINWYRQQGLTHALRPLEAATALQAEASALARRLSSAHCREDYPFRTPHPLFPGTFDANWFSAKAPDCRSATRTWFSQLRHFNGEFPGAPVEEWASKLQVGEFARMMHTRASGLGCARTRSCPGDVNWLVCLYCSAPPSDAAGTNAETSIFGYDVWASIVQRESSAPDGAEPAVLSASSEETELPLHFRLRGTTEEFIWGNHGARGFPAFGSESTPSVSQQTSSLSKSFGSPPRAWGTSPGDQRPGLAQVWGEDLSEATLMDMARRRDVQIDDSGGVDKLFMALEGVGGQERLLVVEVDELGELEREAETETPSAHPSRSEGPSAADGP